MESVSALSGAWPFDCAIWLDVIMSPLYLPFAL